MSLGMGLGAFAQGFGQGMVLGNQIKGAIDQRKISKVEKAARTEATAARENDISAAIQTTQNADGSQSFKVGDQSFSDASAARASAAQQVGTVMDYYRTNTVPKLIQGYIDIGQPEKAAQLQNWMDSEESKGLTRDWARASRMALLGDSKAAMRGFGKLYERLQPGAKYVGMEDVTEPVYEEMKLPKTGEVVRIEKGTRPVGVRLKLRSADGEDISHDFGGTEDLFRTAMMTLSPDKFVERAFTEVDRAEAARAAAAKDGREFRQKVAEKQLDAAITDQQNERQHQRTIAREDRQFAQTTQRDATQSGYRMSETAAEIQMRAALKLTENTDEKPEDVRKSLETITKRLAETDLDFSKLSPEEQTQRAVSVLNGQRKASRGVISGEREAPAGKGIPKLW